MRARNTTLVTSYKHALAITSRRRQSSSPSRSLSHRLSLNPVRLGEYRLECVCPDRQPRVQSLAALN